MSRLDMSNMDPQHGCPFFNRLPGEVRDEIFNLAVTEYCTKKWPLEKNQHYYRPNFRYLDYKLSTTLLRTCRRIYTETHSLPTQKSTVVMWYHRGPPNSIRPSNDSNIESDSDSDSDSGCEPAPTRDLTNLHTLHLFTQQFWLESWRNHVKSLATRSPHLKCLRITIRHGDWWNWESSAPLLLDAKGFGRAWSHSRAEGGFNENSWGMQVRWFEELEVFELELETVEGKRGELDEIVRRAGEWRFPAGGGGGGEMVLNQKKTKRSGWWGEKLPHGSHVANDAVAAKKRLMDDGADFNVPDGEPEITGDVLTYYVVLLTYETRR